MKQKSYYYKNDKNAYVKKVVPKKKQIKKGATITETEILKDIKSGSRNIAFLILALCVLLLILHSKKASIPENTHETSSNELVVQTAVEEVREPEPASSVRTDQDLKKPEEIKVSKMRYMDASHVWCYGNATSIRNTAYNNVLSSSKDGYVVFALNKEFDEFKGVFCVELGSAPETEVSIEFSAIEDNTEYSLPINYDGTAYTELYTNGYEYPKEFSVDVKGVDILKIYMHPFDSGLSYGGEDSVTIIGDPLLIKY